MSFPQGRRSLSLSLPAREGWQRGQGALAKAPTACGAASLTGDCGCLPSPVSHGCWPWAAAPYRSLRPLPGSRYLALRQASRGAGKTPAGKQQGSPPTVSANAGEGLAPSRPRSRRRGRGQAAPLPPGFPGAGPVRPPGRCRHTSHVGAPEARGASSGLPGGGAMAAGYQYRPNGGAGAALPDPSFLWNVFQR